MKKCPHCGAELNDDNLFCTECGKELPKGVVCPHCGASVNEGDAFCTECGKRVDEVPQATPLEPTKPKCPHCGALMNEGDAFCTECGKKIEDAPTIITETSANAESAETTVGIEDSVRTVVETPQVEEKEEESEYHYEYEEEPKTWRDYKLPIFGGIFLVLLIGACLWFFNSSNSKTVEEDAAIVLDSLSTETTSPSKDLTPEEVVMERVKAIYDDMYKVSSNGDSYWLSNELNSLIKKDSEVTPEGELGCIDYNIWTQSQEEGELNKIEVKSVVIQSETNALSTIALHYPDNTSKVITLMLVYERGDWYIDDFINYFGSTKSSLKENLIDSVKSMQEQQNKQEETDLQSITSNDSESNDLDSNDCYYVWGTRKELESMGIISNGSVNTKIQNKDYFTKIGKDVRKEMKLYSKNAVVLSNHPSNSYELGKEANGNYTLKIIDPSSFWSNTNTLVITVY